MAASLPGAPSGVAVCLAGLPRFLETTAPNLRDNLFEPLDADVLLYAPYFAGMVGKFNASVLGPRLVAVRREVENITERVREGAPRWWRRSAEIQGNWLGCWTDAAGSRREGSGMCMAYAWSRCLDMVLAQEGRRGRPYALVVQSRVDFVWGQPHPPAERFQGDFVWVPEGNDWGGVNDRHAVVARPLADAYFGSGWADLLSGAAARQLRRRLGPRRALNCTQARGDHDPPCATHELWLQLRLGARNVKVKRFAAMAELFRSDNGGLECWRSARLAPSVACLRDVAIRAMLAVRASNTTGAATAAWAKLERWCELYRREEDRRPWKPELVCEQTLVDLLLVEAARRRHRSCARLVAEFATEACQSEPIAAPAR